MSGRHSETTVRNARAIASLLALAILWMASFAARPSRAQSTGSPKFHVDSQRLQGTLEQLREFCRNLDSGATRIGFSVAELAAIEYVFGLMMLAGLQLRVDSVGTFSRLLAGL